MRDAVREAGVHLVTTKMEIGFAGMPDWPFADFFVEIEQARFARDFGTRFGGNETTRRRGCGRRRLIARALAQKPTRAYRAQLRSRWRMR